MKAFREKKFSVLVATDVAARGLDCIVDLVVMNKPPATRSGWADTGQYVHRSGRTGRAGKERHLRHVVPTQTQRYAEGD